MINKILAMVLKALAPKLDEVIKKAKRDAVEHLFGKSKRMKDVLDYVHKDNNLDKKAKDFENRLKKVENLKVDSLATKEEIALFNSKFEAHSSILKEINNKLKLIK